MGVSFRKHTSQAGKRKAIIFPVKRPNVSVTCAYLHISYMYIFVYRQEHIPKERKCDSTKTIPKKHLKKKRVKKKKHAFFSMATTCFFMFLFLKLIQLPTLDTHFRRPSKAFPATKRHLKQVKISEG